MASVMSLVFVFLEFIALCEMSVIGHGIVVFDCPLTLINHLKLQYHGRLQQIR